MKEKWLSQSEMKLKALVPENDKPEPTPATEVMSDDTLGFLECMDGTASGGDWGIEAETESNVQTSPDSNQDDTLEFLDWMGEGKNQAPLSRAKFYSEEEDKLRQAILRFRNSTRNG